MDNRKRSCVTSIYLFFVLLPAIACAWPWSSDEITCSDGSKRKELKCSSLKGLKSKVVEANARLRLIGIGAKYGHYVMGKITDQTYQMALQINTLCEQYNACMLSVDQFHTRCDKIYERLNKHLDYTQPNAPKKAIEVYKNALPKQANKKLSLHYELHFAQHAKMPETSLHTSGEKLYSGNVMRLEVQLNQPAYLYIVLLSSQGVPNLLYPTKMFGKNPVDSGKKLMIPPKEFQWELDSNVGIETLQIIASLSPLNKLEQYLRTRETNNQLILASVGQLLCSQNTQLITQTKTSVKCGTVKTRGIILKKTQINSEPSDPIIIHQHHIDHQAP